MSEECKNNEKRERMRSEFASLGEELEIAQYGVSKSGQFRRKVPRAQSLARTKKRKILESLDRIQASEQVETDITERRLRGPKASIEESVIKGSLVFETHQPSRDNQPDHNEDFVDNEASEEEDEENAINASEPTNNEYDSSDNDEKIEKGSPAHVDTQATLQAEPKSGKVFRRRHMYRLRNFKSQRLAQKHGAALGAHAMGKPKEAIQKLKQVAKDAPSAPQLYSSLGLVYEDMLQEMQKNSNSRDSLQSSVDDEEKRLLSGKRKSGDANIPDKGLEEQLQLGKKAYGSFHIAAILCRRDYNLWLRAADSASDVADIHASIMKLNTIPDTVREFHREERRRWLEEAKNDYQSADNLKPPGIDIPSKLAFVMMELGLIPDALTLLTDLKKSFGSSYQAWLLYSDLMLRIGHECEKWNSGVQNASNPMFRRWLRKFSNVFDWNERRLQALSKALEAACGSQICAPLIRWLKARVQGGNVDEKLHQYAATTSLSDNSDDRNRLGWKNRDDSIPAGNSFGKCNGNDATYEIEKQILLRRNIQELNAFDETTRELSLEPNSLAENGRSLTRSKLLQQQKQDLQILMGEFQKFGANENVVKSDYSESESWEIELPLTASCRMVCSIASELLRHLLKMHLYDGGRLVAEAVSRYLKQRYALLEARKEKQRTESRSKSWFSLESNEERDVNQDLDEDMEPNGITLSDDEELDKIEDSAVLTSLKIGGLPTDLKVLYGLCLAGEGGKQFLAAQCIADIDLLKQERKDWLSETPVDTSVSVDYSWVMLIEQLTEPMERTAMYAFVADIIHDAHLNGDFLTRLAPVFRRHINRMKSAGMLEEILTSGRTKISSDNTRIHVVFKVLVASARLDTEEMESRFSQRNLQVTPESSNLYDSSVDTLVNLLHYVWRIEPKGEISGLCCGTLKAIAHAFRLILRYSDQMVLLSNDFLSRTVNKMLKSVTILCDTPTLTLSREEIQSTTSSLNELPFSLSGEEIQAISSLNQLPFSSSWLSTELRLLALRAFNLCLGTNVSLFTGWEGDEFNLRLMRNGRVPHFFGATIVDTQIAGYLSEETEKMLSSQWQLVDKLLPSSNPNPLNFDHELSKLQSTYWYEEGKERLETARMIQKISCFGEEYGLSVLLSFSQACLLLARECNGQNNSPRLVLVSLSILIPITQFCLGIPVWDINFGEAAVLSRPNVSDWQNFDWDKDDLPPSNRPGYLRPKLRSTYSLPVGAKALHERFDFENEHDTLSNIVGLPILFLQEEWKKYILENPEGNGNDESGGSESMEKLNVCMKQLRGCYSEVAVERVCLRVSSALIHVAASSDCRNRFLCIQQAALFASQASKGGSSDQSFHAPLPKKKNCTPLEALLTIGRSDCMQALGFYPEAAFLCSYVAAVSRLNRDRRVNKSQCHRIWKIISVLTYDLSLLIRHGAKVIVEDCDRIDAMNGIWEEHVIDELKRACSDGLLLGASLGAQAPPVTQTTTRLLLSSYSESVDREATISEQKATNKLHDISIARNPSTTLNTHSITEEVYSDTNLDTMEHDEDTDSLDAVEIIEV